MQKLYKSLPDGLHYFEGWDRSGVAILHSGRVGERGTTKELRPANDESVEGILSRELTSASQSGYTALASDALSTLVVQYDVSGWEADEALEFRHLVEEVLNDALGWVGVGHCDGGEIGQNNVNVWCKVVDPELGNQAILNGLKSRGLLEDVVVAIQIGSRYDPIYPPGHVDRFQL
jgi:hypothetical protein